MKIRASGPLRMIKMEPGDEWPAAASTAFQRCGLRGGFFTAIGAVDRLTVAFFDPVEKRYLPTRLEEPLEIVSLIGNAGRDERDEIVLHAHVMATRRDGSAVGGHLVEARVSVTLEIAVLEAPDGVRRKMDQRFGLNLWDLDTIR